MDNADFLGQLMKESKGKTVDLVVEHEIHGVTPEMVTWWWPNMDKAYVLWHPQDHISCVWELPPSEAGPVGSIQIAEERIGPFPAAKVRIRSEARSDSPTSTNYTYAACGSVLGPNDTPVIRIAHEYEGTEYGIKMRSTFRLPAAVPKEYIEALRKHNVGEMGEFPNFLPKLYRQYVNKDQK